MAVKTTYDHLTSGRNKESRSCVFLPYFVMNIFLYILTKCFCIPSLSYLVII